MAMKGIYEAKYGGKADKIIVLNRAIGQIARHR